MITNKKNFGQYFTPHDIADFMVGLSSIKRNGQILEPCAGEGIFLTVLNDKGFKNITAYEIDNTLHNISKTKISYKSFVSEKIETMFDLVIGNPPYIRWKNLDQDLKEELSKNELWNQYFNSLCDYLYLFILKSIKQLKEGGELIFICPEYWLNTTHSVTLRNFMVENGYFEKIIHFNETPIFNKVTVSVIIFKYIKKKKYHNNKISLVKYYSRKSLTKETLDDIYNNKPHEEIEYAEIDQFNINERWILAPEEIKVELKEFEKKCSIINRGNRTLFDETMSYHTIEEICDIGNGLVSGLDRAFQLNGERLNKKELNSVMKVVKAKDLKPFYHENITRYIFLEEGLEEDVVREQYPSFYNHLSNFKEVLSKRYDYSRNIKFWEWVFLRNFNLFSKKEKKIFVPCKERISNKDHFRFALVEPNIFPTQDVTALVRKKNTKESIYYILAILNNHRTFNWLKYNGIVKGNIVEFSEKPIASIPIRLVDWNNKKEVQLHDEISNTCKLYVETKNRKTVKKLELLLERLF